MALLYENAPCAICRQPMRRDDDILAFTFLGLEDERIAKLDDWGAHERCLFHWDHRDIFIEAWNDKLPKWLRKTWVVEVRGGRVGFHSEWWSSRVVSSAFWLLTLCLWLVVLPFEWGLICLRWVSRRDLKTGKPLPPPCPECGERLNTALAQQCFACGADWHKKTPEPSSLTQTSSPD